MRRENEKMLQENIEKFLVENKAHMESSELIFLHAPGLNKIQLLQDGSPL